MNANFFTDFIILTFVTLILNAACGIKRVHSAKFSLEWWFWIHASIPVIIGLRYGLNLPIKSMFVTIPAAVLGQWGGGRWALNRMTEEQKERLQHIRLPDKVLNTNRPGALISVPEDKTAVVLLNMGGPTGPDDVGIFLRRIFEDERIIRFPLSFLLQKPFARLLSAARTKEAIQRYNLIGGSSPIHQSTQNQVAALQKVLHERGRSVLVTHCFNYSEPLPQTVTAWMEKEGIEACVPLSLYPHYSEATTGSSLHFLKQACAGLKRSISFYGVPDYHLHPQYIDAIVDRIKEQIKENESLDDFFVLFSAHGLPFYFLKEGDPYPFEIAHTVAAVLQRLDRQHHWAVSYQSDVGPLVWIKPSTENMIRALARRGCRRLLVVPISFVTDHIETLCEIDIEYRHLAQGLGIEDFRMVKAVECHPGFINALADAVETTLDGWDARHRFNVSQKNDHPKEIPFSLTV